MKITMHRIFPALGLALAGGLFLLGSTLTPTDVSAGGKPCIAKKFATKAVAAACETDQKTAKKLMKKVSKKSKELGAKKTCLACHDNLKDFKRKKGALKDLREILNAMGKS